jgi:hypothetical protein
MIRICEHIQKNERVLHTYPFTLNLFEAYILQRFPLNMQCSVLCSRAKPSHKYFLW